MSQSKKRETEFRMSAKYTLRNGAVFIGPLCMYSMVLQWELLTMKLIHHIHYDW